MPAAPIPTARLTLLSAVLLAPTLAGGLSSAVASAPTAPSTPGAVRELRVLPTGTSGEARVTFASPRPGQTMRYQFRVGTGKLRGSVRSGMTLTGLPDGDLSSVAVRAVDPRSGRPGPFRAVDVSTFAPCEGETKVVSRHYDHVVFSWRVVSSGRVCELAGDASGQYTGTATGTFRKGTGPQQSHQANLQLTTLPHAGDPDVPARTMSALSSTYQPTTDWFDGGPYTGTACRPGPDCRHAGVQLTEWRPSSQVYCEIRNGGAPAWQRTFSVDGNGNGRFVTDRAGWWYRQSQIHPDQLDGQGCRQL